MKKLYNIFSLLVVFAGLFILSCENELDVEKFTEQPAVNFEYNSASIHYVIGEEINFINTSTLGSAWEWNFGDGTTSTEENPVHKYTVPATYKVKLIVDGGKYEAEKSLMISDIVPVVSFTASDPSIVFNQTEVSFDVLLENPENKEVSFKWTFPAGTQGEGIDENNSSSVLSPKVVFGSIGSQVVTLSVTMGDKKLDPVAVNVKVNYNEPVKALYYAVKEGNIMANKIIPGMESTLDNAFNYGYRSGKHPLNLKFQGDYLYVFDAGTYTSYVTDNHIKGDGEIFAMYHDGSTRETVIENFGGDTYYDFYNGYVDQDNIYWTDRREGIFKTSVTTRNQKFSLESFNYVVKNSWLSYYGKGIGWGHVNGPIAKVEDVYYWGKNSNGAGIFRFRDTDIQSGSDDLPADGILANNFGVRGMAIDEVNKMVYFSDARYKMICRCDFNGGNFKVIDNSPADTEGGESELLFITGIAIDVDENGDGHVYWGYRGPDVPEGENPEDYYAANPLHKSGIKRYSLNDAGAQVEYFLEGVSVYGLAIDNTLR